MAFSKVLIANRGEIALRIMRTARALGYRTVAVYSTADKDAPFVRFADEAVFLGPAAPLLSYLSVEKVIDAAQKTGADAIHPGYGFLSERADFARACLDAEIVFVGPSAEAIELMGNKRAAKRAMRAAGVPCVPGYDEEGQDDTSLLKAAAQVGFPIMVKAAAGGGGRGMRRVDKMDDLAEALRSARVEAQNAFGDEELILERALTETRHVEIQVFSDGRGTLVHLGERDCSLQRRHQKVIEECPSPVVDTSLREKLGKAALDVARACDYVGAGTVEFLLDQDGKFYFLEMNTRLQVEHPVTELVTGVDLVAWQLRAAAGEALGVEQASISFSGHAIEARLYAEDPAQNFMPQSGPLHVCRFPEIEGVRVDAGVAEGDAVSPHYDPMIAKVIAFGASRDEARRKLARALFKTTVFGIMTNKRFLGRLCEDNVFAAGDATTSFIGERFSQDPSSVVSAPSAEMFAQGALLVFLGSARVEDESFYGWRSGGPIWTTVCLESCGASAQLDLEAIGAGALGRKYKVSNEGESLEVEVIAREAGLLRTLINGAPRSARYLVLGDEVWVDDGERVEVLINTTHRPAQAQDASGTGRLNAPLDGTVTKVFVGVGERVTEGQPVIVLEAMKMEHRIVSDVDGVVKEMRVKEKDQVTTRQPLAEISKEEA